MVGSYFHHVLQISESVQTVQIQVIVRHVYNRQILEVGNRLDVCEISNKYDAEYRTRQFVRTDNESNYDGRVPLSIISTAVCRTSFCVVRFTCGPRRFEWKRTSIQCQLHRCDSGTPSPRRWSIHFRGTFLLPIWISTVDTVWLIIGETNTGISLLFVRPVMWEESTNLFLFILVNFEPVFVIFVIVVILWRAQRVRFVFEQFTIGRAFVVRPGAAAESVRRIRGVLRKTKTDVRDGRRKGIGRKGA